MKHAKSRPLPSGLPGSHPAMLFVEGETANLTPQESRVQEPEDSIPIQTLETVTVSESPQCPATAISGQEEKSAHPVCVAPGGMKSPCTSAMSVYQNIESAQERNEWLDAIARDDRREGIL